MKKIFVITFLLLLIHGSAQAGDGFESLKCGADIPQALLGKKMSNERVVAIEGRHKDLGLKDLGADEVSKGLTSNSWLICGGEYMLLEDARGLVRDVLLFP